MLVEISDGRKSLAASELNILDRKCFETILSDRRLKWCLNPMVSDLGEDRFSYDCSILIAFEHSTEQIERDEIAYR